MIEFSHDIPVVYIAQIGGLRFVYLPVRNVIELSVIDTGEVCYVFRPKTLIDFAKSAPTLEDWLNCAICSYDELVRELSKKRSVRIAQTKPPYTNRGVKLRSDQKETRSGAS